MLKNLSVYVSLMIISLSMSACSNNKANQSSQTTQTTHASQTTHAKKAVIVTRQKPKKPRKAYKKRRIVPVVYKKRRPVFRQVVPRRRPIVRSSSFTNKLSHAALGRLKSRVRYDGSYHKISYPWGDVPQNIGVCTDVVIRSYRKLGIDLQQQVHRDMSADFNAYPNVKKWGLSKPDSNIDHRRVYNLRAFFARRGAALPITRNPSDYRPGDLVTWMVGKNLPHIGIVVNRRSKADPRRFMIVHNIAYGPQMDDVLFRFPITGHYRYTPSKMRNIPKPIYASSKARSRPLRKKSNSMDYAQLMQAAKILGTQKAIQRKRPSKNIKKVSALTIANLSNTELQKLLTIK